LIDLPTPPTEMDLRAIREFSERMTANVLKLNTDIISFLPGLNEILKKAGLETFPIPAKLDL
jgi:hypothetical protein